MRVETIRVAVPAWAAVIFAALAALVMTPGEAAAAPPRALSIAEARALPLGTRVTLEGTVSTPSGAFASSFFDQGFGLQDRSAGIYVSIQTDLGLVPRERARVTGTLTDSFGLLILAVDDEDDVESCGRGGPLVARHLATSAVSEATEGLLVTVKGSITRGPEDDLPYGYKFFVDDGSGELTIFVNLQTEIDVAALAVGQRVTVAGFSSQFDDHYEIDPRSPADVRVVR